MTVKFQNTSVSQVTMMRAVDEAMLSRLRVAVTTEYPVSIKGLLNNYQQIFQDTIKPEEFDCPEMDVFILKVSADYNVWKEFYDEKNNLMLKPTRVSSNVKCHLLAFYVVQTCKHIHSMPIHSFNISF